MAQLVAFLRNFYEPASRFGFGRDHSTVQILPDMREHGHPHPRKHKTQTKQTIRGSIDRICSQATVFHSETRTGPEKRLNLNVSMVQHPTKRLHSNHTLM